MTLDTFLPWREPPAPPQLARVWVLSATALLCLEPDCGALYAADGGNCPRCLSPHAQPVAVALDRPAKVVG